MRPTYETRIRVRYGETDLAGHVNNAVYLTYLEQARLDFVRDALDVAGVPFIVASARLDYVRQAFYRDSLLIQSGVSRLGHSSFDIDHQIVHETSGELVVRARAVLVHFNYQAQRPEPLPAAWRDRLAAFPMEPLFPSER
ncbi:MAG: thioesterase family protein [Thermaerobacter sp.]|nr:thioesterase family protein [Thermaerobacter sp.]